MCTVIGFSGKFEKAPIPKILDESRCRGVHAFGYSFYSGGAIKTKKFLNYLKFKRSLISEKPNKFIAHFRYSTSGDWQKAELNQPLEDKSVALAFNGVISQKSKTGMEDEFNIRMPFENDGFILLDRLICGKSDLPRGATYATCFLRGGEVFALRNRNRPLHLIDNEDYRLAVSTANIAKRAGINKTALLNVGEEVNLCSV